MADTARSYTELLALLADNTNGDISPQDVRDLICSGMGSYGMLAGVTTSPGYYIPYGYITCSGSPALTIGETITQVSGGTAVVHYVEAGKVWVYNYSSSWTDNWTGGTSGVTFTPTAIPAGTTTGQGIRVYTTDPSVKSEMTANTTLGTLTPTIPGWYLAIATGALYMENTNQGAALTLLPNTLTTAPGSTNQITSPTARVFYSRTGITHYPFCIAEVFDMTSTQSAIGLIGTSTGDKHAAIRGGSLVVVRIR